MKYTFHVDLAQSWINRGGDEETIRPGDNVLVFSKFNVVSGTESFFVAKRFAEHGYPGNTDPKIKRFHGWCGTTDNIAIYAYGVYSVKSVTPEPGEFWEENIKIVLNKKDLKEKRLKVQSKGEE